VGHEQTRVPPKPTFWVKNGNNHFLVEFQGGQRWIYSIHPAVQIWRYDY